MKEFEKKKIEELFEYRKLPFLLSYIPKKKDRKKLYKKLVKLQYEIYCLDRYLENNWKLKKQKLKDKWAGIYSALKDLGYNKEETYKLTSHIRRYQKHETQLRESLMPTILNKEYYYYYKSCDVRLMRSIIYSYSSKIIEDSDIEDWRYFDLITEIDDDVEDVFEDQTTINGNMFLISIIESGTTQSKKDFTEFIEEVLKKELGATKGPAKDKAIRERIKRWTEEAAKDTLQLLEKNTRKLEEVGLSPTMPLLKYEAVVQG